MNTDFDDGEGLICLVGTGRNGSTLLTRVLDGAPEVDVLPIECAFLSALNDLAEFGFISSNVLLNASNKPLIGLDQEIAVEKILLYIDRCLKWLKQQAELVGIEDKTYLIRENLLSCSHYSVDELIVRFLVLFRQVFFVENSRKLTLIRTVETPYIADYIRLFPRMKFIHLVRNPVNVWRSNAGACKIKKQPQWYMGGDNLRTVIDIRWLSHAKAILSYESDSNHFVIRYEDLADNPEKELTLLTNWLGINDLDFPAAQTIFGGKPIIKQERSSSYESVPFDREVRPDTSTLSMEKDVKSEREKDFILYRAHELARALGYFENVIKPSAFGVAKKWLTIKGNEFFGGPGDKFYIKSFKSILDRRKYIFKALME